MELKISISSDNIGSKYTASKFVLRVICWSFIIAFAFNASKSVFDFVGYLFI